MQTLNLGLLIEQGTDFSLNVAVNGLCGPIDLTGYSFAGEMKTSTDSDAEVVAEFVFAILDQYTQKGIVNWSLPASVTEEITTSVSTSLQKNRLNTPFVFDVKMEDTNGNISRIIQGIAYVSPQATQELD